MAKVKYLLIPFILAASLILSAGFTVTGRTASSITVSFSPQEKQRGMAVIIPAECRYSVTSGTAEDVYSPAVYYSDFYLLPLKAMPYSYTAVINYTAKKLTGRIVKPDKGTLEILKENTVNWEDALLFLKPRSFSAVKSSYDGTPVARMSISNDGMYRVTASEIAALAGIDLSSYAPSKIKMYNLGSEVPLHFSGADDGVFSGGDYFLFYGERLRGDNTYFNKYDLENSYILTVGGVNPGARYVIDNTTLYDSVDAEISTMVRTIHFEEDSVFKNLPGEYVDTSDLWFFGSYVEDEACTLNIDLKDRTESSTSIGLRTYMHGISHPAASNPDHPVEIYVNGSYVKTMNWNDNTPYMDVIDSVSTGDTSSVSIIYNVLPLFPDTTFTDTSIYNGVALNWAEIKYTQDLKMSDGKLLFRADDDYGFGTFRFRVTGFPNTNLYLFRKDLKKLENLRFEADSAEGTYTLIFDDEVNSANRDFAVYQTISFEAPDTIVPFINANLSSATNEGDYIVIVDQNLIAPAEKFASLFEGEHHVFVAGSQEIYNEFNYGVASIEAISSFIKAAYSNWSIPPTHVLFLGDGSFDNNNHLKYLENHLPLAFLYETGQQGFASSDNYFGRVVGNDPIEDVSIARYPVRNEGDINEIIFKINHFLDPRNSGAFNLRNIFFYDTSQSYPSSRIATYNYAALLPEYIYPEFLEVHRDWNTDLLNEISKGASYINMLAHGAKQSIGYATALRIHDVYRMTNFTRLPFVSVFSCVTGYFDELEEENASIGEAFVMAPFGGAIAYYGSSAPSFPQYNHPLDSAMISQFSKKGERNIGRISQNAELEFLLSLGVDMTNPENLAVLQVMNYNLLGLNFADLNIPFISDTVCSLSSYTIAANDTLSVTMHDSSIGTGKLETVLLDCNKKNVALSSSQVYNGFGINTLLIPDTVATGNCVCATVASTSDTSVMYISYPSINATGVKKFYMSPSDPDTATWFSIEAVAPADAPLGNPTVFYRYSQSASYSSVPLIKDGSNPEKYSTQLLQPPKAAAVSSLFEYYISYTDTLKGVSITTQVKSYYVPALPDIRFESSPAAKILSGKPVLFASVRNGSERPLSGVLVGVYSVFGAETLLLGTDTIDIPPYSATEAVVRMPDGITGKDILFWADRSNLITESKEDNNRASSFVFDYDLVKVYEGTPDTFSMFRFMNLKCAQNYTGDTLFLILTRSLCDTIEQNIEPAHLEIYDYIYTLLPSDTAAGAAVKILFSNDSITQGGGNVFVFSSLMNQYELTDSSDGDFAVVNLDRSRVDILPATFTDKTPPYIDVCIENPDFVGGMLLSNTLKISCSVEDNEGIKLDRICIAINSDTLKEGDYTILKRENPRSIPVRFSRFLKNGLYELSISAYDIYNNKTEYKLSFKVANQFNILYVGNFPNPVRSGTTVIACELTQNAKSLELNIYNANGRRIFKRGFASVEAGRFTYTYDVSSLPNGTYFYRFDAVSEDDERVSSIIQKMSVLK